MTIFDSQFLTLFCQIDFYQAFLTVFYRHVLRFDVFLRKLFWQFLFTKLVFFLLFFCITAKTNFWYVFSSAENKNCIKRDKRIHFSDLKIYSKWNYFLFVFYSYNYSFFVFMRFIWFSLVVKKQNSGECNKYTKKEIKYL